MKTLTKRQLELMKEAGIAVPDNAHDDRFMEAEDDELLGNLLMDSLAPGQEWTPKAQEIQDLLNYLASEG